MSKKTFSVECTMEERWIPHFLGMLKKMESYGKLGHSAKVTLFSDGDGDFRPKFVSEVNEVAQPRIEDKSEAYFDAG